MVSFMKHVLLQMRVCGKIYRREWNVTQQARGCAPIKAEKSKLTDNVDRAPRHSALDFGSFTLDLQPDFPVDFQCKYVM
jgi:hypothetical protein